MKRITIIDEEAISEYFEYIKTRIDSETIFRLLSPMLQIFWCSK